MTDAIASMVKGVWAGILRLCGFHAAKDELHGVKSGNRSFTLLGLPLELGPTGKVPYLVSGIQKGATFEFTENPGTPILVDWYGGATNLTATTLAGAQSTTVSTAVYHKLTRSAGGTPLSIESVVATSPPAAGPNEQYFLVAKITLTGTEWSVEQSLGGTYVLHGPAKTAILPVGDEFVGWNVVEGPAPAFRHVVDVAAGETVPLPAEWLSMTTESRVVRTMSLGVPAVTCASLEAGMVSSKSSATGGMVRVTVQGVPVEFNDVPNRRFTEEQWDRNRRFWGEAYA